MLMLPTMSDDTSANPLLPPSLSMDGGASASMSSTALLQKYAELGAIG